MRKQLIVSWIRIGLGLLGASAVVTQLFYNSQLGFSIVNFFSFFTIESNILAAVLLLIAGIIGLGGKRREIDYIRGAATLYMSMTGIIYVLLLAGSEVTLQTTLPWVNMVLHYIMPVAVLLDWLLYPPKKSISYSKALLWLLFPVIYVIYSFIRGSFVGWYPYPFLNPLVNNWTTIIFTCVIIALGVLVLTRLLIIPHKNKLVGTRS